MKPRIYMNKVNGLITGHKIEMEMLLEIPKELSIRVMPDKKRKGNKIPTAYYAPQHTYVFEDEPMHLIHHTIFLILFNIRDRKPAKFDGTFEEKLIYVLAHEMMHVKQELEGRLGETETLTTRDYKGYLEIEDEYMKRPEEQEANAFALDYLKTIRGAM